jgi:putative heme iron utilization protein
MVTINLSNDQLYNMVKLYDILRDMDMDLNDEQISAFENIQDAEVNT